MMYMLDEIILARIMTTLDLEFKSALHYHNEKYESNNDYGLPPQITGPIHVYSVFTTQASFDLADLLQPGTQFHPSLPHVLEACHSLKGSAIA